MKKISIIGAGSWGTTLAILIAENGYDVTLWVREKEVEELIVCQPAYLPKKRAAKGDYQDALQLANALRGNHLEPVFHDADNIFIPLRALASSYRDIVCDIRRSKNRLKAVFRAQGINVQGKGIYTQPERIKDLKRS